MPIAKTGICLYSAKYSRDVVTQVFPEFLLRDDRIAGFRPQITHTSVFETTQAVANGWF